MKIYDDVKVIRDSEKYNKFGIYKGMIGRIVLAEIRDACFYVNFIDKNYEIHKNDPNWFEEHYDELEDDKECPIKIEDLQIVKENWSTDESILRELPQNNPKWWCKVEDGYILNLLGEKKNKIPYDYNS